MGILEDPLDPHALESLRRSLVMLTPGQAATLDRGRALALLEELQRLQRSQRQLTSDLEGVLARLTGGRPGVGPPPPAPPPRR